MLIFFLKLCRFLPLNVLRFLAGLVAFVANLSPNSGMLWKTRVNLTLAYPQLSPSEIEQSAKITVRKQCLAYAESVKCWAMPPSWAIQQIHTVHHDGILRDAFASGAGVLIITPHLATWEMMNAWVHQFGTPTIMYKPMRQNQINQFVRDARQALQANLVPTDAQGVKALFKELKQGGFSVILPDHVPNPVGGVVVPFFQIPCLTATLASKMIHKTHCRVVGLSCYRRDDGMGFNVYCDDLSDNALYDSDLTIATTALNQAIEKMIARSPTDYHWAYRRFKFIPDIENVYALEIKEIQELAQKYAKNSA